MSYNTFAKFYDTLTENVEYKKRVDYISSFFKRYADKCDTVLDLACGTGSVSKYLSDLGYNVIGLDLSDEMLTPMVTPPQTTTLYASQQLSFIMIGFAYSRL